MEKSVGTGSAQEKDASEQEKDLSLREQGKEPLAATAEPKAAPAASSEVTEATGVVAEKCRSNNPAQRLEITERTTGSAQENDATPKVALLE